MTARIDHWFADHMLPVPATRWRRWRVGSGSTVITNDGLRLLLPRASSNAYSNAQLDDYHGLPHRHYPWHPPLRLDVRARFGGSLLGTAGFGLWNHPFVPLPVGGVPILPRAVWFFHASPPNNMALARGVPGHGWKTATLDALRPRAIRWAPFAPVSCTTGLVTSTAPKKGTRAAAARLTATASRLARAARRPPRYADQPSARQVCQ
jgi:hypothetical protein